MLDEISIEHNGRRYLWTCELSSKPRRSVWSWGEEQSGHCPPTSIVAQLDHLLEASHKSDILAKLDPQEAPLFREEAVARGWSINIPQVGLELAQVDLPEYPRPYHLVKSPLICDWLKSSQEQRIRSGMFFGIGAGPLSEVELQAFLQRHWMYCWYLGEGMDDDAFDLHVLWQTSNDPNIYRGVVTGQMGELCGNFVIGREEWDEELLDRLIDRYRGRTLRIFSQEMLLIYLVFKRDPFKAPRNVLREFQAGHPALEFLSTGWPGWVSTFVSEDPSRSSSKRSGAIVYEEVSPIKLMGYKVGKKGLPRAERRQILANGFQGPIPSTENPVAMAEWGKPGTSARLHKMANWLSSICTSGKRKARKTGQQHESQAVKDWEEDLAWLKAEFYNGRHTFSWPQTFVE